jgi:excinuclease ABC subunit C
MPGKREKHPKEPLLERHGFAVAQEGSIGRADLKHQVATLPRAPGVYLMRDKRDKVIYVGKARDLRARVRSYFNKSGDTRYFVRLLDKILARIEFIVTTNEKEAVLLESTLIKAHRPRYNIHLRDDKNYLLIRIDRKKTYPRVDVVRRLRSDGARYFGPFHSARAARTAARFVSQHFGLRICSDREFNSRRRPCIQFHMDRCPAPCCRKVDAQSYRERVDDAVLFLKGHKRKLVANLRERMEQASEKLEFEQAAALRDKIQAIQKVVEPQDVINVRQKDQDVVGFHRDGEGVEICLLEVRAGRLVGRRSFLLKRQAFPDPEVISSFLGLYYTSGHLPPAEVLVPVAIEDDGALADVLSERRQTRVTVQHPRRSTKKRLVELACRNAAESHRRRVQGPDPIERVENMARKLHLSRPPRRMECFDISHLHGDQVRGSMAVFIEGRPEKKHYRLFKVEGLNRSDDYEAMWQVLKRRLARAKDAAPESGWALPDLLVVDGGRGQLRVALAVLADLEIPLGAKGVDVVAIAKGEVPPTLAAAESAARYRTRPGTQAGAAESTAQPTAESMDEAIDESTAQPTAESMDEAIDESTAQPTAESMDEAIDESTAEAVTESADAPGGAPTRETDHVYRPRIKDPLPVQGPDLLVLAHLRDEAHRFAIKHHRKAHRKAAFGSELETISGIGPKRRKRLLRELGSLESVARANTETLIKAGLPKNTAQKVFSHFHPADRADGADRADRESHTLHEDRHQQ